MPPAWQFVSSFEDPRIGPYLVTRPVCHSNLEGYLKSRRESKPEPQLSLLHVITFIVQLVETGHRLHEVGCLPSRNDSHPWSHDMH